MLNKKRLSLVLLILYFVIPKFDILSVGFSYTGLRIQDFISLSLFMIHSNSFIKKVDRFTSVFYILFILGLLISLKNDVFLLGVVGWLRNLEYLVVAYSLYFLTSSKHIYYFFNIVILLNLILIIMQFIGIAPIFHPFLGLIFSNEYAGFYGNAAEYSYFIIAIVGFYFLLNEKKLGFHSSLPLFLVASTGLFNGVRASLLSFLSIFAIRFNIIYFALIFLLSSSLVILSTGLIDYLLDLVNFSVNFLLQIFESNLDKNFNHTDLVSPPMEFSDGGESDRSLQHRFSKWLVAIIILLNNFDILLFGYGAYTAGGAMDGGVLRFIFEYGLVLSVFASLFMIRLSFGLFCLILSTNIFFDGYISSIVMPIHLATILYLYKIKTNE